MVVEVLGLMYNKDEEFIKDEQREQSLTNNYPSQHPLEVNGNGLNPIGLSSRLACSPTGVKARQGHNGVRSGGQGHCHKLVNQMKDKFEYNLVSKVTTKVKSLSGGSALGSWLLGSFNWLLD